MNHASLFTGIGGFDLAAQWMGWKNVFQVEIDPFCLNILKQNFPDATRYEDIKEFDGTPYRGAIDVISGGFPCQPYSTAGKRKGKDDDRHLWPEMLRVIREVQPGWVVGENVRGLINWNGGMVFDEVQFDLEASGYEVLPFLLPACAVNAPHRRDRIWFIAHACSFSSALSIQQRGQNAACDPNTSRESKSRIVTHANIHQRSEGRVYQKGFETAERHFSSFNACGSRDWKNFPTQSPLCGRDDGISFELDIIKRIEHEQGFYKKSFDSINAAIWALLRSMWWHRKTAKTSYRVYADNIYHSVSDVPYEGTYERWYMGERIEKDQNLCGLWSRFYALSFKEAQNVQQTLLIRIRQIECRKKMEQKQRVNRIKALGNAVVPQVVLQIFKAIEQNESLFIDKSQS